MIKIITSNLADVWHIFSLILLTFYHLKGLALAIKASSNWWFLHNLCIVSFSKLVYQNKDELPGTSMAFTMIASRFEKNPCLLKSSVPLPWQPNLIKTLPTGVISKLLIQTRGPIPTYILLNPVSLLWSWHFKHGVYTTSFPFPWLVTL